MKSKPKVLFVITRLGAGGAPVIMLENLRYLRSQGYDVELATGFASKGERDLLPEIKDEGFMIHVISSLVRNIWPIHDLIALFKLKKLMKKNQYDIVHTHTSKAGLLGRYAARLAKIKVIIHSPHGHIFEGYFNPFFLNIYIFIERLEVSWTTKVITLTKREIKEYLKAGIGDSEDFTCIYNGIDVDYYGRHISDNEGLRTNLGISSEDFVVSTVGRLVRVKGHKFLLEAVAQLKKKYNCENLKCLIVGDGQLAESLKSLAVDLGINENVIFVGHTDDIVPYLTVSDLFVLSSLNEGFGLVLAEAMAAGLTIVSTAVGGIPEVVDDPQGGTLVPAEDAEAMAKAVIELMKDPSALKEKGAYNQLKSKNNYSVDKMNNDLKKLYEEVLTKT